MLRGLSRSINVDKAFDFDKRRNTLDLKLVYIMLFSNALYYPTIDIKNDRWLKSAVLFWDSIETIVPQSMMEQPYENSTVRVLHERNIIKPHFVNSFSDDVIGLEDDVQRFICSREGKRLLCDRWFYVSKAQHRKGVLSDHQRAREAFLDEWRGRNKEKYGDFFIHIEKLPQFLQEELRDYVNEDGFVATTPEFLGFYMTLLANNICRRHNLSLLTDKVTANDLSNKIIKDKTGVEVPVNSDPQNLQCLLYRIVIDCFLVDPTTTIEKIVRFKEKYRDELCRFRQEVSRLTTVDLNLTTIESVTKQVREIYENNVIPSINDLKKALDGSCIKWVLNNVTSYMVSGIAPASLKMLGMPLSYSIPVSAGLAIGLTRFMSGQARKEILRNSPYTYLVRVNREFSNAGKKKV